MKKAALPAALLLLGIALSGCPIYDHEAAGCYDSWDCAFGYVCDVRSGACVAEATGSCRRPSDCDVNETCDRFGSCSPGDCSFASTGCVRGYECSSQDGIWECVPSSGSGAGGASGAAGEAGSEAGAPASSGGAPAEGGSSASASGAPAAGAGQANTGGGG